MEGKMLQNVTFCYVFVFFSVDRLSRDPVAEFGRLGRLGCILMVAGHAVYAGIGGVGDSYPDLVDAAWANPC
jgi:hypothetical protein